MIKKIFSILFLTTYSFSISTMQEPITIKKFDGKIIFEIFEKCSLKENHDRVGIKYYWIGGKYAFPKYKYVEIEQERVRKIPEKIQKKTAVGLCSPINNKIEREDCFKKYSKIDYQLLIRTHTIFKKNQYEYIDCIQERFEDIPD